MAQGSAKLGKSQRSSALDKRRITKGKKSLKKGAKQAKPKKTNQNASIQAEIDTSKAINRKNESVLAAKAVAAGNRFFLSDISEKGTKEMNKQLQKRNKKESKATSVADKVREQLRKLGKDV